MMTWKQFNKKFIRPLASLKLAVFIIILLAVVSAIGTFYESRYDARMAQKLIYHSWPMKGVLLLLSINLIAVMLDRLPWKKRHISFILAHIGIIIVLIGAILTEKFGVDGSMSLEINGKNQFVVLPDELIKVYGSFEGERYTELMGQDVDFINRPPHKYPLSIVLGQDKLEVVDYYHFALRETQIEPSEQPSAGPSIRVQFKNDRVNMTQWALANKRRPTHKVQLGPAELVLTTTDVFKTINNAFIFKPIDKETLSYRLFSKKEQKVVKEGVVKLGDEIATPWMGLKLKLIKYLPAAEEVVTFKPVDYKHDRAVAAVKIRYKGKEHWVGRNAVHRFFEKDRVVIFTYQNKKLRIGVPMHLKEFRVGRYQGTMRASSYASEVLVEGEKETQVISMNNPLKRKGFTFYQASFSEDETGKPVASVLSVNYDPGRPLKYLGSLLIVLGATLLFYRKWGGRKKVAS